MYALHGKLDGKFLNFIPSLIVNLFSPSHSNVLSKKKVYGYHFICIKRIGSNELVFLFFANFAYYFNYISNQSADRSAVETFSPLSLDIVRFIFTD